MRKILSVLVVIVAVVFVLHQYAVSEPFFEPPPDMGDQWDGGPECMKGPGCALQLSLTADQANSLRELRQAFMQDTASLRDSLRTKRMELDRLFRDATTKDAAIAAKGKELSALREEMAQKVMEYRLKARKILTPEQLGKLPVGCHLGFGMGPGPGRHPARCQKGLPPPPPPAPM